MRYALNIAEDGRILSVTYEKYVSEGHLIVDELPEGDISDYLYVDGDYVYSPLPKQEEPIPTPSQLDRIEAQITYTAMMTNTLLEV